MLEKLPNIDKFSQPNYQKIDYFKTTLLVSPQKKTVDSKKLKTVFADNGLNPLKAETNFDSSVTKLLTEPDETEENDL